MQEIFSSHNDSMTDSAISAGLSAGISVLTKGLGEQSSTAGLLWVLTKAGEGVSAMVLGAFLAWLWDPL